MTTIIDEDLWFGLGKADTEWAELQAAQSMAATAGRIVGTKPFPASARRLADLTKSESFHMERVVQVLETDPALSIKLLRVVNSAGYGLRVRCTSVRHAATLVGADRLHQLATTAAVLDLFASGSKLAVQILEHLTVVGAISRYLGGHLSLPLDDLFTCGFLHDIGKLMMIETEGKAYIDLMQQYGPEEFYLQERKVYGFDHAVLAAHVLRAWNIPEPVPKVVAYHHEIVHAYDQASTVAAMAHTLHLADMLSYALVRSDAAVAIQSVAQSESASYLDISEPQLAAMWPELRALYQHSKDQVTGDAPPVIDAASCRPKQPLGLSAAPRSTRPEAPKQFPCVVCGASTYGARCVACRGHVCAEHQNARNEWCDLCEQGYRQAVAELRPPVLAIYVYLPASLALVIGLLFVGGWRLVLGPALLLVAAALVLYVGSRWWVRRQFLAGASRPHYDPPSQLTSLAPPPLIVPGNSAVGSLESLVRIPFDAPTVDAFRLVESCSPPPRPAAAFLRAPLVELAPEHRWAEPEQRELEATPVPGPDAEPPENSGTADDDQAANDARMPFTAPTSLSPKASIRIEPLSLRLMSSDPPSLAPAAATFSEEPAPSVESGGEAASAEEPVVPAETNVNAHASPLHDPEPPHDLDGNDPVIDPGMPRLPSLGHTLIGLGVIVASGDPAPVEEPAPSSQHGTDDAESPSAELEALSRSETGAPSPTDAGDPLTHDTALAPDDPQAHDTALAPDDRQAHDAALAPDTLTHTDAAPQKEAQPHQDAASPDDAAPHEGAAAEAHAERQLGEASEQPVPAPPARDTPRDDAFTRAVVEMVADRIAESVAERVANLLAREVVDSAGADLADAVAARIASRIHERSVGGRRTGRSSPSGAPPPAE